MPDASTWITAIRASHDRAADVLGGLDDDGVQAQSYDTEWSIADVASHLGSQAEIFGLFLDAGLSGAEPPSNDAFGPIWERWNALPPAEQVRESIAANEAFVSRLETIPEQDRESFGLSMFGMDIDLAGFASMRLGEQALHLWDIEVALDKTATVADQSVALLIDTVAQVAGHAGTPAADQEPLRVATTEPSRQFVLTIAPEVQLEADDHPGDGALVLPAEAFIRAIYGRLDPEHLPVELAGDARVDTLRGVFPGM